MRSRVFGQQVKIYYSDDGTTLTKELCAVNSFDAKKNDITKESTSLGETGLGNIEILDDGWTLSFSCEKTDSKLIAMFIAQTKHIQANGQEGQRGIAPYFVVVEKSELYDGSFEEIHYVGAKFHSPEHSTSGKNDAKTEKFEARAKKAILITSGDEASNTAAAGLLAFTTALDNIINLSSPVTKGDNNKEFYSQPVSYGGLLSDS